VIGRLPIGERVPDDFYNADYYVNGLTSNYKPYGPGQWCNWLVEMLHQYVQPMSLLDVGCAYGFIVGAMTAQGTPSWGFDVSAFAMENKVTPRVWQGTAEDPEAWKVDVDLVLAMAVVEHLTESQNKAFIRQAAKHGQRLMILAGAEEEGPQSPDDQDTSHIGFLTHQWWIDQGKEVGLYLNEKITDQLNADDRANSMHWATFMFFTKQPPAES
jgi:hypothetical protein